MKTVMFIGRRAMDTISPCTFGGTLSMGGSPTTVTSTTQTIDVPTNNSGDIRFQDLNATGSVTFQYSKNGGAFTAIVEGTTISMADTNTLAVRITGAASGEAMACNLIDVTTAGLIEEINLVSA